MIYNYLLLLISIGLISGCTTSDTNKEDFSTIYFEPFPENQATVTNPFSTDNSIYKVGKKFVYEFIYTDSTGTIKDFYFNRDDFSWTLENNPDGNFVKIDKVKMSVQPRGKQDSTYRQTNITYQFLNKNNHPVFFSGTGLVENEKNIWIHPPRHKLFKVLQLSPFPFIQKPYEIGHQFYWQFTVGEHYSDPRHATWKGLLKIKNQYTILDEIMLDTPFGKMEVLKIKGVGTSRLGKSQLIAYFSHELGFIELKYVNIDKSTLEMKLVEVMS